MNYERQCFLDTIDKEVQNRLPKKKKRNKKAVMYGYKNDFLFDITQRELNDEEVIEIMKNDFYDEL